MATPLAKQLADYQAAQAGPAPDEIPYAMMPQQSLQEAMAGIPATTPPRVQGPDEGQQMINSDMARLNKVRMAQARPYGFAGAEPSAEFPQGLEPNHPGKMGHVLHALSVAGNIAGDIFAPATMANIPGTQLNMQAKEGTLAKRLNEEIGEESLNKERGTQTGHLEEETKEMPAINESKEKLEGAQAEHLGDEAWKALPGVIGPNGEPVEIEGKSGNIRFGDVNGLHQQKTPRADTPEQQYLDEYAKLHQGSTVAQAERAYTLDTQKPPQQIMLVPQAGGGFKAQNVMPGSTVTPDAMTASGVNSVNVPTSATRSMAEVAPKVIDLVDRSEQLIDQQVNALGPAASRWNEFMAGKVGAPNTDFTKLRTNIGLLQTALMRMHVGARGGEQIMEHFRNLIDSSKQSPENLKAALGEIKLYADAVAKSAKPESMQTGNQLAQTTWKAPEGAPAAPKEDGKYLYDQDKKPIAKSQGGKWVQP